jgi:hypothetical protein
MPHLVRVDVVLPYITNLPRDVALNTLWWEVADDATPTDIEDAANATIALYNTAPTGAPNPISNWLSTMITRDSNGCRLELYNQSDSVPRSPIVIPFTLGAGDNTNTLPLEVAVCGSFAADPESGVAQGRLRGRNFYGPLTSNAITFHAELPPTVTADLALAITKAQLEYRNTLPTAVSWVVWSRTANLAHTVTHGWCDNEFDTQRRRQVAATTRHVWSI